MTAFKIVTDYTFPWPVKVKVPNPTRAGQLDLQQIDAIFRARTEDDARRIADERAAIADDPTLTTPARDRALADHERGVLRDTIVGWDQNSVRDAEGNPVPFSPEALAQVLQFSWARIGFYEAYARAISGGEARLGN